MLCCGKGANPVVSRLHFVFENHDYGEKEVYLHADNCTGQNKNSGMIQYVVLRTLTNRHTSITLSFRPVGHTKFVQSIAQVVNTSAECNFSQLVSREDWTTVVATFDWIDSLHLK